MSFFSFAFYSVNWSIIFPYNAPNSYLFLLAGEDLENAD